MSKRFLNVVCGNQSARIDTKDMEDLSEMQEQVKKKYGLVEGFAYIQLWNKTATPHTLFDDLDEIKALPEQYYWKAKQPGALFLTVQVLPSPSASRQTNQAQWFIHTQSSPELSAFWNALKVCTTPIEKNQVIQLPTNVFILGNPRLGSSIFIRHCYPKLLETALSIIQQPRTPHLVILGNPGIGQTYFGYVLLLHLARSDATVVYESGTEGRLFLLSRNVIA
jgi:hypothetical protein